MNVQGFAHAELVGRVPAGAFKPPPKVAIHSVPSASWYSERIWSLESPLAVVYCRFSVPETRHSPLP